MIVLAVDVGGTHLRSALVEDGTVVDQLGRATHPASVATQLTAQVGALLAAHPSVRPAAIGVGLPEFVRDGEATSNEVVAWPAGRAGWLSEAVAAVTGGAPPPVVLEADVRCGALAEHAALGSSRDSLLYVSWGTGVSSALVLPGGRVWAGARGEALALGEWRDDRGRRLEDVASGRGIERAFAERGGAAVDARSIHALAQDGDPLASELFGLAGRALGRAIHQLIAVLDPSEVVLGGGLGTSDHLGRRALLAEVAASPARVGSPPVRPARLEQPGLSGAALLAERAVLANPASPRP